MQRSMSHSENLYSSMELNHHPDQSGQSLSSTRVMTMIILDRDGMYC